MENFQTIESKLNSLRHQTLDSLYFVNYSKQKQMQSHVRQGSLLKRFRIAVLIRLLHWKIVKLQRSVEHLQTQVLLLRAKELLKRK
ncbi:MAG: hypothetical protein EBR82_78270 [Caulobacteraceae bacterium]|nr:hypothetical protein [Caulobacteraceae bacterium]